MTQLSLARESPLHLINGSGRSPVNQAFNGKIIYKYLEMGDFGTEGYQLPHSPYSLVTRPLSPRAHCVHVESSLLQIQVCPQESSSWLDGSRFLGRIKLFKMLIRQLHCWTHGKETQNGQCHLSMGHSPTLALFHFLRDLVVLESILRLNL